MNLISRLFGGKGAEAKPAAEAPPAETAPRTAPPAPPPASPVAAANAPAQSAPLPMPEGSDNPVAFVDFVVKALVDSPEAVKVHVVSGTQAVIFEVAVDPIDVRRVIGRRGRTADALREILTNLGSKAGRRFMLEIVEPER